MIYGQVSGNNELKRITSKERVVVKVSTDIGFSHEISMYLQEDGRVECRYFDGKGGSKSIFKAELTHDDIDVWVKEDWNG
jgi:uncharacterized protein YodC (DUF2158 family)